MKKLWDYIDEESVTQDRAIKQKKFLLFNTIIWILIPLLVCGIIGLFTGFDTNWGKITFILTGYSGILIGFIAGYLFLCSRI